jgi:SPX domain protein involved in polyphosphate accumulation
VGQLHAVNGAPPPAGLGAFELKIDLESRLAPVVTEWASCRMVPDTNAAPDGTYTVSSVYFDTAARDVYRRSAGFEEYKYRARRYGRDEWVFFEEKRRVDDFVTKRRSPVPLEQAAEVLRRDDQHWFVGRTRQQVLAPVCRIMYRRLALECGSSEAGLRLTLDSTLVCANSAALEFSQPQSDRAIPIEHVILELKFQTALPKLFKDLLAEFHLAPSPVSKYRLAMDRLLHSSSSATAPGK